MSDDKHSVIAPSGLHAGLKCLGWYYYKERYPETEQSPYAAEGTMAHEFGERVLTRVLIEGDNFHEAFQDLCSEYKDSEMQAHVQGYCQEVLNLVAQCKPIRIAVEKKFVLSEEFDIAGTADFVMVFISPGGQRVLVIVDLKYGQGVTVEVIGNPQLPAYAAAANETPDWGPVDRAIVYIYQPRCEHPDGALRSVRLTKDDLATWKAKIMIHAVDVQESLKRNDLRLKAGSHCRFCRGKAVCPEYRKDLIPATADFLPVPDASEPTPPAELSDETLKAIVLKRKQIEEYLAACEAHALSRAKSNEPIPGLKVVFGRSVRKWGLPQEEIAGALQGRGVANPWKQEVIGITEAKKQIGDKNIGDLCIHTAPGLKVVSVDDPRPEALTEDFKEVEL